MIKLYNEYSKHLKQKYGEKFTNFLLTFPAHVPTGTEAWDLEAVLFAQMLEPALKCLIIH